MMYIVKTPLDDTFNYAECEEMFELNKEKLQDDNFDKVIKDTYFYAFHEWKTGKLLGCIYYFMKDNKLFVNGFATRGHHLDNLHALKKTLGWFNCDVYANALHKTSEICVKKCGFEKIKDNLFIYRRKK